MSMEFRDNDSIRSGDGGALMGLMAGSMINRDKDDGRTSTMMIVLAVIFFVIIFIIAIIALAMFNRENKGHINNGTDIGALLAPILAAKSMDCNNKYDYDHDHLEIKDQIAHSEDRREISGIKSELGAVALMMQKTASDNEKDNLKEFGDIKQQLSAQSIALTQILQTQNNKAIIDGVLLSLLGKPCMG